jgi:hypothetical protein
VYAFNFHQEAQVYAKLVVRPSSKKKNNQTEDIASFEHLSSVGNRPKQSTPQLLA